MTRWSVPRAVAAAAALALLTSDCVPAPVVHGGGEAPLAAAGWDETDADAAGVVDAPDAPPAGEAAVPLPSLPVGEARALGAAELRRAVAFSRSGDTRAAQDALDRAAALMPVMRDWANLLAADAAAQGGDTAAVRRRLAMTEPIRAREWGWRFLDRAYRAAGDSAGALRVLEAAAAELADDARRAEALRLAGELRLRAGDVPGALAAFRRAMEVAPQSRAAREAAAAAAELPRTAADRLLEGRVWLRHGNVDRGVAAVADYLASGFGAPAEHAEARLLAGRALFNARRYAEAERYLLAAAREPQAAPAVAAEAWLLAGRAQFRAGRGDQARTTLRAAAERFPHEPAAAQALFILGDLEHDAGRTGTAAEYYRRAAASGADVPEAALAAVRLAGLHLLAGDARAAAQLLDGYAAGRAPDRFTAQARYWAARAYLTAGERERARERLEQARRADPVSYYGKLATDRLGGSLADLPLAPEPVVDETTQRLVDLALFRVDLLRELGLAESATFEMERSRAELDGRPGALYLIAEAHLARGAPVAGILLGREIQRREGAWNARLLRIVYPFPHRALIEAEARRHGLDPFMVAGLIRQESMFNPIAVSPAGAVGLMQVMPATGRGLARRAGIANFDPSMLRRPEINVRLGTLFLADLLNRLGTQTEAFAAYNAGPSRVARWRELPEFRDEELFAERIPITETRDYVKILAFNARIYRLLYGD